MKLYLLFLVFLLRLCANAQWSQLADLGENSVYGVKRYDSQFIYAGTYGYFLRSLNNGATWDSLPILDQTNTVIPFTTLKSIHFVTSQTGFATGQITLGNSEAILKTTNGGVNWQIVSLLNTGNLPRILNQLTFFSSTLGYAVGTNGRILKTVDGGTTWTSQTAGISNELTDVQIISSNVIVAVGDNYLIRSINGGSSWTTNSYSGVLYRAVHFPTSTVGYACGDNNAFYKTTNQGASWSVVPINLPGIIDFKDVYFATQDTGYAIANNLILKTCDGGLHWSKYVCGTSMNNINFYDMTSALACGNNGLVYNTANAGIPYQPIAIFNYSPISLCCDSIIYLNNQSSSSNSSFWFLNNTPISSSYNTAVTVNQGGQADTLKLVVSNGVYSDTMSKIVNIQPSLNFLFSTPGVSADTVCSGMSVAFYFYNTVFGVTYNVKIGNTLVQSQGGNGGTRTFNVPVTGQTTFTLQGVKNTANCGSFAQSVSKTIYIGTPNASLNVLSSSNTICKNSSVNITILNSELNVTYQLKKNNVNIAGATAIGNGSSLTIPTGPITANSTISVYAYNSYFNCSNTLTTTKFITVEGPLIYYSLSNNFPEVGELCSFSNSSINIGGTCFWEFQNSDSIISNVYNPSNISFNSPGNANVKLVCITPNGCRDSIVKTVNVLESITNDSCWINRLKSPGNGYLLTLQNDKFDNKYMLNRLEYLYYSRIYGHNNDSVLRQYTGFGQYNSGLELIKMSPKGAIMWNIYMNFDSGGIKSGGIETDDSGNVYCYYYHGDFFDSLKIHSQNGKVDSKNITIAGTNGAWKYPAYLLKFDKFGDFKWIYTMHTWEAYTNKFSISIDSKLNLYLGAHDVLKKIDSNGNLKWSLDGDFSSVVCDSKDNVWAASYYGDISKIDSLGVVLDYFPRISDPTSVTSAIQFEIDEHDNLYMAGYFHGNIIFAYDTLYAENGPQNYEDYYLLKVKPDGTQEWIKQFVSKKGASFYGIDVKRGKILSCFQGNANDTVFVEGANEVNFTERGYAYYLSDTIGQFQTMKKIYEYDAGLIFGSGGFLNLKFNNLNDGFVNSIGHNGNFQIFGQTISPIPGYVNNTNIAVINSDIECSFDSISSSSLLTYSYFVCPNNWYTDSLLQLTDLSTNNPTSWNWNVFGATNFNSTLQHPVFLFTTSGYYTITLTASNTYGSINTMSRTIYIDINTGVGLPQKNQLTGNVKVYPNPNSGDFIIKTNIKGNYNIINNLGQKIQKVEFNSSNNFEITLSNYQTGIYYLVGTDNAGAIKIVVTK